MNPGVHQPHWKPCVSTNARWTGCPSSPSTVVTSRPAVCAASVRQPLTGSPSSSTVHAPHTPIAHVSRAERIPSLRSAESSISSLRASSTAARPLSTSSTFIAALPPPARPPG